MGLGYCQASFNFFKFLNCESLKNQRSRCWIGDSSFYNPCFLGQNWKKKSKPRRQIFQSTQATAKVAEVDSVNEKLTSKFDKIRID